VDPVAAEATVGGFAGARVLADASVAVVVPVLAGESDQPK
jgi:hypothetical protein